MRDFEGVIEMEQQPVPRGWVGVDVGKGHHWVCLIDEAGTTVWSSKVVNDESTILEAAAPSYLWCRLRSPPPLLRCGRRRQRDRSRLDIDSTRDSLARDLDELQGRVSPSAIVDRRKEAARSRVRSLRGKVMGGSDSDSSSDQSLSDNASQSARDAADRTQNAVEGSPLAAGLIAFGAGLVVAALIPASQAEVRASKKVVDVAQEQGQPLIDEAKAVGQESAEKLKGSATEAAEQVKSSAQDSAQKVKNEGASSADTVKQDAPGGS